MLFLFYTNTIFSKFTKLNISTNLFKKRISFSHLTQTITSLQSLKGKTSVKAVLIISEIAKRFFFFFHCRECYKSIGSSHADALVGFHVFMKHCQVPVYLKVISNSLFKDTHREKAP